MSELARTAGGSLLMLVGVGLLTSATLLDLAHTQSVRWFERRPVLIAAALGCMSLGALLVP